MPSIVSLRLFDANLSNTNPVSITYVVVYIRGHCVISKCVNGKKPNWNEEFAFQLRDINSIDRSWLEPIPQGISLEVWLCADGHTYPSPRDKCQGVIWLPFNVMNERDLSRTYFHKTQHELSDGFDKSGAKVFPIYQSYVLSDGNDDHSIIDVNGDTGQTIRIDAWLELQTEIVTIPEEVLTDELRKFLEEAEETYLKYPRIFGDDTEDDSQDEGYSDDHSSLGPVE
ncbi:hypothetical protein SNEBB_010566 [Seison nebaliae]|nr:hypothetical protein SNEBB_010566 [Seison nebaliae]